MKIKILPIFVVLLLGSTVLLAQERTVTGRVTDESQATVPGASVLIKGTTTGTVSDADGNFTIAVSDDDVLIFSFIGYSTQEILVGSQTNINVIMQVDITQLQEIVVTGYATQQKKDLTGSVGVVETKDLIAIPTGNVTNQLQGRVAGVTVTGSGQPGTTSKVRIRGFGSFQNNDPLYIVDGVPTQDISTLNPNDVESLSVLKDAGAASIYGSRASNGVIIITTKKGKSGVSVSYNMYVGSQSPGDGPEGLLKKQGYADLQFLVYDNDGTVETHPIYGPSTGTPQFPNWAADTDWYDELTDNASISNHDISLSGGNENAKFYGGFCYY